MGKYFVEKGSFSESEKHLSLLVKGDNKQLTSNCWSSWMLGREGAENP